MVVPRWYMSNHMYAYMISIYTFKIYRNTLGHVWNVFSKHVRLFWTSSVKKESLCYLLFISLTSELGGPSGKSFRFVCACVRAVALSSEIGQNSPGRRFPFFLFVVVVFECFPFSLEDSPAP